jgi:hypothetical protein
MTGQRIGTQEEWQAARDELLAEEKEVTRRNDELARKRHELPWVRVEKEYRFDTDDGTADAGGAVRRSLPAPRLPLHVRAELRDRLGLLPDPRPGAEGTRRGGRAGAGVNAPDPATRRVLMEAATLSRSGRKMDALSV